jgi:hypothetical protein
LKKLVALLALLLVATPSFAGSASLKQENARLKAELAECHKHHSHHSRRAQSKRHATEGRVTETARREVVVGRLEQVAPVCVPEQRAAYSSTSSSSCVWDAVRDGFGLTAGFRWDREQGCPSCPTCTPAPPTVTHHETQVDPFFVGAELRLPLASRVDAFGNIDRDFVEAPHWSARVGLSVRPWAKR